MRRSFPRNQSGSLIEVSLQFPNAPRAPGVIAGRLNAAAAGGFRMIFKPGNIIALPAMERNWDGSEGFKGSFGIDAPL